MPEAIQISPEFAKELHEGETVVWTGYPPLAFFHASHAVSIPIGLGLLFCGWLLLNQPRPAVTGRLESDFIMGLILLSIGGYLAFVEPWINSRRRRRTEYALTNCRAMIQERGKFLAMYFLNENLETELIPHRDGTASIRFGTPSNARWLGSTGKRRGKLLATEMQLFSRVPNGNELLGQIRRMRSRPEFNPNIIAPFVRRVAPERQYDTEAPAPTNPLDYAQPVRAKMMTGEATLFITQPPQGLLFRTEDWFYTPFAAIWTIIALQFVWRGLRFGCPVVIGLVFVAVGLYMLIGRFYHDRSERRRKWYAVTNRRCLIVIDGKIIETKSLFWHYIQGLVRRQCDDRTATLFFELSALGRQDTTPETDITSMRHPGGIYFERIDDSRAIESLVMEHVGKLSAKS